MFVICGVSVIHLSLVNIEVCYVSIVVDFHTVLSTLFVMLSRVDKVCTSLLRFKLLDFLISITWFLIYYTRQVQCHVSHKLFFVHKSYTLYRLSSCYMYSIVIS